jgi:hypothetical protein
VPGTRAQATIGSQSGVLTSGQAAALILGALVTVAVAVLAAGRVAHRQTGPDQQARRRQQSSGVDALGG